MIVTTMPAQIKAKSFRPVAGFWLLYFVLSIVVIGAVLAYGLVIPLYLLGYFWPAANAAADRVMRDGIRLLMAVQPWFSADIRLDLPSGGKGCLLLSNHRSHLDAFVLLSRVKGIRILAKSSLFFVPFLGAVMRASKQIPVKRGNLQSFLKAMDAVRTGVAQGQVVHVFPEMTRCAPGFEGTQDFSIAPFHAAMQGGFPVIPVVFQKTDEVWPRSVWGLRFRTKIRVRSLEPLDPRDFVSSEALMRETRQRIQHGLET